MKHGDIIIVCNPLSETMMCIKQLYCEQWQTKKGCQGFYIKEDRRGIEQDRERVGVRGGA
jgi:hypothetical protein